MRPKLPALLQMALSNVLVNIANQFVDSDDDLRLDAKNYDPVPAG